MKIASGTVPDSFTKVKLSDSDSKRLWENVRKMDSCWVWTGARTKDGYGKMKAIDKVYSVHRLSWMIHKGKIPAGMNVLHRCDNPPCINPDHLWIGTTKDNVADKVAKKRHGFGMGNPPAKLNDSQVLEIREVYSKSHPSISSTARKYKISRCVIYGIINGKLWRHLLNAGMEKDSAA